MIVTFLTTKKPALSSGSEVRNHYLLQALINSPDITKVQLIYIQLNKFQNGISEVAHEKVVMHTVTLSSRSILSSISAYVKGRIPYVEHIKNHKHQDELEKLIKGSQVLLLSELDGYFAVHKLLKDLSTKRFSVILDSHNVDHVRFQSEIKTSNVLKKNLGSHLVQSLKKQEIEAVRRVDHVLACSMVDKNYFSNFIDSTKISVIPNGVKVQKSRVNNKRIIENSILFMGSLDYEPNNDALRYYFDEIHQLVKEKIPDITVTIIGKQPKDWLKRLAQKDNSIKLKGFVPDVWEYLEDATVCICPLRFGSGTRLKILEYMAAGKLVVSTTVGAEGLDVDPNKNILIADSAEKFARSIVDAVKDEKLRNQIGIKAKELVTSKYNWVNIGNQLVEELIKIRSK